ncbi:MAG TPA: aldehyde dehydrogenase family protein [Acidobacteriaceae bacterium]|nr:aldehyde dehydrogenase family protein [Acidobacteriaceae bacterium]
MIVEPMTVSAKERIDQARTAQTAWALLSLEARCRLLRSLRKVMEQQADEIVRIISAELAKPPMDALTGDLLVTLEHMLFYEKNAARILKPRHRGKPAFLYRAARFTEVLEPHGVALIMAPWNYPLQLSMVPAVTALFAGNAVLLKCSEHAPRAAALIADLCSQAGLPPGLVQVSCEAPSEAAALVSAKPDIIFFTGSSENGHAIAESAARHGIPLILELGGSDAALVFASCDLERTVNGVVYGSFANAGQVCVGIKRIYVEQSIYAEFLSRFLERVSRLRLGNDLESDLGVARQPARLETLVQDAVARGAAVHGTFSPGEAIPPLVLTGVPPDSLILQQEFFGPVVCVAPFSDQEEALRLANASPFALGASLWTGDSRQGRDLAVKINAGTCAVNDVIRNVGNPCVAFGGNGRSGYGRYHGEVGLRTFSRIRSIMVADKLRDPEPHWFPFSRSSYTRLRAIIALRHGSGNLFARCGQFLRRLRGV